MYDCNENFISKSILNNDIENRINNKKKILVIGSNGVGKSSILERFFNQEFIDFSTNCFPSYEKKKNYTNENFEIQIVNLEEKSISSFYLGSNLFEGKDGCILLFSLENSISFDWIKRIINLIPKFLPKILVANKSDLKEIRKISIEEGKFLAKELTCEFIECSAKANDNLGNVFQTILNQIEKFKNKYDPNKMYCKKIYKFLVIKEKSMINVLFGLIVLNLVINF